MARASGTRVKGITVEIGGDVTGLDKALSKVNTKLNGTQSQLRDVDRLLKLDPTNTNLLEQRQRLLATAVIDTKTKLESLKEAEKQVQKQFENGEVSRKQYDALQREIVETEQNLKSLEQQAKSADTALSAALGQASAAAKEFGGKATAAGKAMLPLTGAITGLGVLSIKSAADFESAFAGVQKTVEATEEEFAALREGILALSERMPQSATEIAAVAEAAGQLGIKTENILEFTETMVMLGDATNLSSEEAAVALARLANITQMPQSEFSNLGSTVVALGNNLATTESEIVNMSLRLAGAGKQVGLTEAQTLSLAGALSSVGIEADAGGSAFSKVMVSMQLAAETGGESLESFAAIAGMTANDFAQAFRDDAAGALLEFIGGLQRADETGQSAIKMLDDMGITEVRMRDALLRAAGAGDVFSDALKIGTAAWEENNALTKEAAQRYETFDSQMAMVKNQAANMAAEFGEVLLPIVLQIMEKVSELIKWFSGLDEGQKNTIVTIALLVAAIGPLLMILGQMSMGLGSLLNLFSTMSTTVIPAVGQALSFLAANPIVLVIAAIVALVALIALKGDEIQAILQRVDGFLQNIFVTDWTQQFGVLGQELNFFFAVVKDIWDGVKMILDGIINFIRGVFTGDWERAWLGVQQIFKGVFDALVGIVKAPLNAINALLNAVIDGVNSLIKGLNKISFDIPDWVPGLGGKSFVINIPLIGKLAYLAKGGVLKAGNAIVGEKGPELLSMVGGNAVVQPLTGSRAPAALTGEGVKVTMQNTFYGYSPAAGAEAAADLMKTVDRALGRAYG